MKKRGIGSVVSLMIIATITIVAVAILLAAYFRSIKSSTSNDSQACLGIDLEVKSCFGLVSSPSLNTLLTNAGYPAIGSPPFSSSELGAAVIIVERHPGGKDIEGLKFVFTDANGMDHVGDPIDIQINNVFNSDTDYSDFVEYTTTEAAVRDITYVIDKVAVAAVVGKSKTVCPVMREPVECTIRAL